MQYIISLAHQYTLELGRKTSEFYRNHPNRLITYQQKPIVLLNSNMQFVCQDKLIFKAKAVNQFT